MPSLSVRWSQYYRFIRVLTILIFMHVCLDESLKQLVKESKTPISAQPGQPERFDYQYERNGTANLFMLTNPIEGWRTVEVTEQRTAIDYAHVLKNLVDEYYPEAWVITVVQDNLNTHNPSSRSHKENLMHVRMGMGMGYLSRRECRLGKIS